MITVHVPECGYYRSTESKSSKKYSCSPVFHIYIYSAFTSTLKTIKTKFSREQKAKFSGAFIAYKLKIPAQYYYCKKLLYCPAVRQKHRNILFFFYCLCSTRLDMH